MAGTSNSNLVTQAQGAGGAGTTVPTTAAPVTDISQIPTGAQIYAGGGINQTERRKSSLAPEDQGPGGGTQLYNVRTPNQNLSVEQYLNQFYTNIANNQQTLQQFATEAELAGLVKSGATQEELYAAWQKLVVQAYNHSINKQQVTPWDVLANSIPGGKQGSFNNNNGQSYLSGLTQAQIQDIATNAASKSSTNQTQKTSVDINYTDPDTARYLMNQAAMTLDGRQATNEEIANFTKLLNSNEAKFPKMTQSTETTSGTTDTTAGAAAGTGTGISETGAGSGGQTIVGYDQQGNPIYGPTDTSTTSSSTAKNVTDTNIMLGEADYTRYGREQLAEDAAKAAPDYGAYQAGAVYFQDFLNALKNPVGNVGSNQ